VKGEDGKSEEDQPATLLIAGKQKYTGRIPSIKRVHLHFVYSNSANPGQNKMFT